MSIAREQIDPDAEKVVRRLKRYGHTAYLVGGCVRDLLLGRTPKDFDIATSATPNEIKDHFRNCRIIGRRFRLAHIFFGQKIIETSTFRMNPREGLPLEEVEELLIRRDNVFGTAEEDARRRDFTINGLFYDLETNEVIDYVGGLADLDARLIRTIGDPDIRFREDPVRILRAIKFAARLGFEVEPVTYAALLKHKDEIHACAPPRVLEEVYRLLRGGAARRSMELLLETGVAHTLAPELAWMYGAAAGEASPPPPPAGDTPIPVAPPAPDEVTQARRARAWRLLDELDRAFRGARRTGDAQPIDAPTNALLFSCLVAPFTRDAEGEGDTPGDLFVAVEEALRPLATRLRVSRRDAERARQILLAQRRLAPTRRRRARPMALVRRDYFGEALLLYDLMARTEGRVGDEVAHWWQLWRRGAAADSLAPAEGPPADRSPAPREPPGPDGDGIGRTGRRRRRRRGGRRRRRDDAAAVAEGSARSAAPADGGGSESGTT